MGSGGRPPSDIRTRNGLSEEVKLQLRLELQEGARHRMRGANAKILRRVLGAAGRPAQEEPRKLQESRETGGRAVRGQVLKDLRGGQGEEPGFYSECTEKPVEHF